MNRRQATALLLGGIPSLLVGGIGALRADNGWLSTPRLQDIWLVDQSGRRVAAQSLLCRGPVAVSFMFTGCSTVCPPQTALLRAALRVMGQEPGLQLVRAVSITVTPLTDTPAQLRDYARRYDLPAPPAWSLVTGEEASVQRVVQAFGMDLARPNDHSSQLWLGDPERNRWTRCSSLTPPSDVVTAFRRLLA